MRPSSTRVLTAIAILGVLLVAAFPLYILLDLTSRGDGMGICPSGLAGCKTPLLSSFQLSATLVIVIMLMLGFLRFVVWMVGRMDQR